MAFVRVQGASANSGSASASTVAVTISAVASGNAVLGVVSWVGAGTLTSVTDDKGNTYNKETSVLDTTDALNSAAFSRTNITNAPTVITANFSAGVTFRQILVDEFSGGSTASTDERDGAAHGGQFQANPGTAANGITSGTFTTATNGDLIWGACVDGAGTLALATNGTSFSTGTQFNATDYASQTEFRTQATAGAGTAATFTQAADVPRTTFMVAIKPAAGAGSRPPPPVMWRTIEGAPYPTALQTWTQRAQTIVLSVRPPPVYHYPVPRGAEYPFGLYTLVNQRVQFTPQRTVMNYEWPVPRTVEYPTALRTWASGPPRAPVAAMPPGNCACPLARGVEYPIELRSAVNQRVQFLPAPAAQPPANYEYPVPRSVEYPTALRTWVSGPTPISFPPLSYQFPLIRAAEYPIALRTWISQTTLTPGISYTLTAAAGAFTLTGQSAILARTLTSAVGGFAESGKAATFNIALTSARGAFNFTGNDATLTVTGSVSMAAGAGSFTLTGRPAELIATQALGGMISGREYGRRRKRKTSREELDEILADLVAEIEGPKTELEAKRAARRVVKRAKHDGRLEELKRQAEQAEHKRLDQAELIEALADMAQRRYDDEMGAILLLLSH
jgi:hypothetical protein